MQDEFERADQRGFQRRDRHFAIALRRMAIAGLEQCARHIDRQEQRGTRHQQFIIHIAAVDAGRGRIHPPECGRWCHAHAAEERRQLHLDTKAEFANHAFAVQGHDLDAGIREIIGEETRAIAERCVAVGDGQIDLPDPHFQRVAGFGAFDGDRPGQDMPARPARGERHAVEHGAQFRFDIVRCNPSPFQADGAVGEQRVHHHRIPRSDRQHRLVGGIIMAPRHGLWGGLQMMGGGKSGAGKHESGAKRQAHGGFLGQTAPPLPAAPRCASGQTAWLRRGPSPSPRPTRHR